MTEQELKSRTKQSGLRVTLDGHARQDHNQKPSSHSINRVYVFRPGRGLATVLAAVVGTVGVAVAVGLMLFFMAGLAIVALLFAGALAAGVFKAVAGRRPRAIGPKCPKCGKPLETARIDEGQGVDAEYQFCPACCAIPKVNKRDAE